MLPKSLQMELDNIIKEYGLEEIKAQLNKHAEASIELVLGEQENYEKIGNSRIAGYPDLPSSIEWPCDEDGEYWTFIAQINLSELPRNVVNELPQEGILYFFLGLDEPAYDVDHKIFYYNGDFNDLQKTLPPEGKEEIDFENRDFISHQISFIAKVHIPSESELEEILLEDYEDVYEILCYHTDRLWGNSDTYAGDPKEDAYFCRNGLENLLFHSYMKEEDLLKKIDKVVAEGKKEYAKTLGTCVLPQLREYNSNKEMHKKGIENWHSLLKIGSIDEVGMCWWDAGDLEFLIDTNDLKNKNFSNTYAHICTS
ncbi:YwqG family protein [Bacillus sp. DX1.1]|uniref:YwqG family protein n=1 Tax=unclassified Bacillus (in: firmicutes) TaxID=185979 RepID=UPI002570681C|nr:MULTISPECIES: YwqG family protein [unclassified Bacillus (in: firmicutes)]MDM5153188.1 YwqG family protein [Bacillus sp. DX1.1]WJE82153.1 YwqG family protein [Bacillus sp. DX3.1]